MRTWIAALILITAGIAVSSHRFLHSRTTTSYQRKNVSGCQECHGEDTPEYSGAPVVHSQHTDYNCIQCHNEITNVTGCWSCHPGGVPATYTPARVHRKHTAFNCSRCHTDDDSLKAADRRHRFLEQLGLGAMFIVLAAIMSSLIAVNRSGRVS